MCSCLLFIAEVNKDNMQIEWRKKKLLCVF